MRSKRLYLLTIVNIVVLAIIFNWLYPEVSVTAISTVIVVVGFIIAAGTNYVINRVKQNQG